MSKLDSRKVPTTPTHRSERSNPVSSLNVPRGTPLFENERISPLVGDPRPGEVLRKPSEVVPTITAYDLHEYRVQMERVVSTGAKRVHLDLMDGIFAPTKSPDIDKLWIPPGMVCDIHLMYQHPFHQIKKVLALNPSLVILHAESDRASLRDMLAGLAQTKVHRGIALLQETEVSDASELLKKAEHALVFSGHLGCHGGVADMGLLDKVTELRTLYSTIEIGWDGGIRLENIGKLAKAGVDVLNVGGAVHGSKDPKQAFEQLSASGMMSARE